MSGEKKITVRKQKIRKNHTRAKLIFFLILTAVLLLIAAFAKYLCPYDPYAQDLTLAQKAAMPGASSGNRPLWQRYAVKSDYRKYCEYLRNTDPGSCDHGCGNCDRNFMWLERRKNRGSPYAYFRSFSAFSGTCFCTGSSCCAGRRNPGMRSSPWL